MKTVLRSRSTTVTISTNGPFVIIGERINPTGRPVLTRELRDGDVSRVGVDAAAQVAAGADVLDVNAGIPLADEAELLKAMLLAAQEAVDVPLCLDSSVVEALDAALSVYDGRALVNSVTAENERLEQVLPLVARHGAAVIGLTSDETGIPRTARERLRHARTIVRAAGDAGIAPADVVIDPLAIPVGADPDAVSVTLEAIRLIRDGLGVNMCLGASNVGFGLPRRRLLDAAFLPMAMAAGLTSAIMSTAAACVEGVRAADLLLGHDRRAAAGSASCRTERRQQQAAQQQVGPEHRGAAACGNREPNARPGRDAGGCAYEPRPPVSPRP